MRLPVPYLVFSKCTQHLKQCLVKALYQPIAWYGVVLDFTIPAS